MRWRICSILPALSAERTARRRSVIPTLLSRKKVADSTSSTISSNTKCHILMRRSRFIDRLTCCLFAMLCTLRMPTYALALV